jgi:hypothetical protein
LHLQINQIKSVDTKLKTGIAESLREPLMKIAQKLLISDKATFEQLTTTEQQLWTRFETADIYRFLTGEEDTVPEFQYNWTSVPKLQPIGPSTTSSAPTPANTDPPVATPAPPPAPAFPLVLRLLRVPHTLHLLLQPQEPGLSNRKHSLPGNSSLALPEPQLQALHLPQKLRKYTT